MEQRLGPIGSSRSTHGQASGGSKATPPGKFFWPVQPIVELPFVIRVFQCGVGCRVSYIEKILQPHLVLYFSSSLIIVKSLQLRGRRQIAEPRKYCLVHVIVFLWRLFFSIFCFSLVGNQVKFPTSTIQTFFIIWLFFFCLHSYLLIST